MFGVPFFYSTSVKGLLGTGPPPDPTLESALPSLLKSRFGIETASKQEIDVESMSNRCRIDAKSTPEKGRVRQIQGWGPGGACA